MLAFKYDQFAVLTLVLIFVAIRFDCFPMVFGWNLSARAEEQSQLQIVEREEIEDEEDLFEAIDKRKIHVHVYFVQKSWIFDYLRWISFLSGAVASRSATLWFEILLARIYILIRESCYRRSGIRFARFHFVLDDFTWVLQSSQYICCQMW